MSVLKRIHVNKHIITANRKKGTDEPPLTVKVRRQNIRAYNVKIHGPSFVVYSPDKPLSCGATVWIETRAMVTTPEETID